MKNSDPRTSILHNVMASSAATALAEFTTLPVCTIKTNFQNQCSKSSLSIPQTIKKIYNLSGIKGFYAASPAAIASQVISTSSKYVLYRYFEDKNMKYSNKLLNGLISGVITSLFTHPLDCIKIYMQMGSSQKKRSFINDLKEFGPKLFYRGYDKTLFKTCVGSSLFFPLYDTINTYTDSYFLASLMSAIISTTAVQIFDYLKTRHIYGLPLYQGLNPKTYYKGYTLNLMRVVPHFMIVMISIEHFKKLISNLN